MNIICIIVIIITPVQVHQLLKVGMECSFGLRKFSSILLMLKG